MSDMSLGLDPNQMSAEERLSEIAEILAVGLIRLRARQSSGVFDDHGESSLAYAANQSGHAETLGRRQGTA